MNTLVLEKSPYEPYLAHWSAQKEIAFPSVPLEYRIGIAKWPDEPPCSDDVLIFDGSQAIRMIRFRLVQRLNGRRFLYRQIDGNLG